MANQDALPNQVNSLCENCIFRGVVTIIDYTKDNATEEPYFYFCKNNNIKHASAFELPQYNATRDDTEGNLTWVQSQVVNCTEFQFTASAVINYINSLAQYNSIQFTVTLQGGFGNYNLQIWSFEKQQLITTFNNVPDGTNVYSLAGFTAPNGNSRYYGVLVWNSTGTPPQQMPPNSNIYTLFSQYPNNVLLSTTDIAYASGVITYSFSIANSSGVDTLKIYNNNGLLATIANAPNGINSVIIDKILPDGNYTFWCYLVASGVTSNIVPITIQGGVIT